MCVGVSVNKALLGWISIKQALLSLVFLHIQHHTMGDSDPFECRLTFLSLLEKLNASQQSITKVANYAVRHRKVAEDLYRCLVDELEQVIVFFFFFPLETGCAAAYESVSYGVWLVCLKEHVLPCVWRRGSASRCLHDFTFSSTPSYTSPSTINHHHHHCHYL